MRQVYQLALIIATLLVSSYSFAVKIDGYQKQEDADYQFSNLTLAVPKSEFYLAFSTLESEDVSLTLNADGKTTDLAKFSLEPGITYKFPSDGKSIALSAKGKYTFNIMSNGGEILDSLVILIDQDAHPISFKNVSNNNMKSMSTTLKTTTSLSFLNADFTKYVVDEKPIEPIAASSSTRSAGSKIYKAFSNAVPLIENSGGLGSGVFIENDLILTNKHVVGDQSTVRVALKPAGFGKVKSARRYQGRVIKFDDTKDLALVKLNMKIKDVPLIKLASKEDVEVAMQVHAIGHPRGQYWSYTLGYVSQIRPEYEWAIDEDIVRSADIIQTQTPINPGNSGGPLISNSGKLIGINSFGRPDSPGLNYAVAYTSVKEFLESKTSVVAAKKISSKTEDGKCEQTTNPDGWPLIICDDDKNGITDRVVVDGTEFGEYLDAYIDRNENQIFEMTIRVVEFEEGNSAWVIRFDSEETGSWTKSGADYDKDGNIDEWL
jgi:S1-C subfamily serine protease